MTYTHPHMKVARMEAAVEVLGSQIAELSAAIDVERRQPSPDQAAIDAMNAQRMALGDEQDDLRSDDIDAVARILGNRQNVA